MFTHSALSFYMKTVSVHVCVRWQRVWPHQLQVWLGAGQGRLQAVVPASMFRVGLRVVAAHGPPGNSPGTHRSHTSVLSFSKLLYPSFTPQGEKCIMGQERSFRKRKDTSFCIKGKSYTSALSSQPCQCTDRDFTWWAHVTCSRPEVQIHSSSNFGICADLNTLDILFILIRLKFLISTKFQCFFVDFLI